MKIGFVFEGKLIKKIQFQKGSTAVLTIGRIEGNDIVLSLPQISKKHAQLIYDEAGDTYLIDLESRNGTFVNGNKLIPNSPNKISIGDKITLAVENQVELLITQDDFNISSVELKPSTNVDTQTSKTSISEALKGKNKVIIGRNDDCDFVISSPSVSRKHAMIERISDSS
ncbi:MAG TPA: hypothetical protein DEF82_01125, partial [Crocinitomicaceae bacterium]|nr:hypothetical protein [Crocinitomicaceae bacterium]